MLTVKQVFNVHDNAKTMQTFEELHIPKEKIKIIVSRATQNSMENSEAHKMQKIIVIIT